MLREYADSSEISSWRDKFGETIFSTDQYGILNGFSRAVEAVHAESTKNLSSKDALPEIFTKKLLDQNS